AADPVGRRRAGWRAGRAGRHDGCAAGGCGEPWRTWEGRRVATRGIGLFWRLLAVVVVKPPLLLLTRRTWRGAEHIPRDGGVILAVNHLSHFDPLAVAHFVYDAGRWPQFLAKQGVFD